MIGGGTTPLCLRDQALSWSEAGYGARWTRGLTQPYHFYSSASKRISSKPCQWKLQSRNTESVQVRLKNHCCRYQSILTFIAFWHHERLLWRIRNRFQPYDSRGITLFSLEQANYNSLFSHCTLDTLLTMLILGTLAMYLVKAQAALGHSDQLSLLCSVSAIVTSAPQGRVILPHCMQHFSSAPALSGELVASGREPQGT